MKLITEVFGKGKHKKPEQEITLADLNEAEFNSLDPLLNENTRIVSLFKLNINMKFLNESGDIKDLESPETLNLRLLYENTSVDDGIVKLELYSDYDLFFYYTHLFVNKSK